jgi:hypothetical protein
VQPEPGLIGAGTVVLSSRNDVNTTTGANADGAMTCTDEVYETRSGAWMAACGL